MKRSVRFLVLLTAIVLTMTGCSVRKEQISPTSFTKKKGRVTAFVNVNLIPMTEEKIIENPKQRKKGYRKQGLTKEITHAEYLY